MSSELDSFLLNKKNNPLLKMRLDELRTFYYVGTFNSINRSAKHLSKDYTAARRDLDSIEESTYNLLRGRLVDRSGRGQTPLTPAGESLHQFAADVLDLLRRFTEDVTKDGAFVVKVGLTTFLLSFIETLVPRLHAARTRFESRLVHLRTGALEDRLLDRTVHCAFGGKVARKGHDVSLKPSIRAKVLGKDQFGFVLNYSTKYEALTVEQIFSEHIPLVLPTTGVIFDFICEQLGTRTPAEVQERINVVEWCDDVHFGFEIMRLRLHEAGMFMLRGVHEHFRRYYDGKQIPVTRYFELPEIDHEVAILFLTNEHLLRELAPNHPISQCIELITEWTRA